MLNLKDAPGVHQELDVIHAEAMLHVSRLYNITLRPSCMICGLEIIAQFLSGINVLVIICAGMTSIQTIIYNLQYMYGT